MAEVYVSTDVEADGPIPGPHSLLSFASAAFTAVKTPVGMFAANLTTLPEATGHPDTMAWWATQPRAWAACRADPRDPAAVMPEYVAWLKALPGKPVFVGYPAAYDFLFVYWYLIRFAGESPFSHSALDVKTYAMAVLGTEYRAAVKRNMPRDWFDPLPHTHVALDDARGEACARPPATSTRSGTAAAPTTLGYPVPWRPRSGVLPDRSASQRGGSAP